MVFAGAGPARVSYPTYGNYGGPGYSDGEILTSPDQPVDYQSPPKDALDQLFLDHDKAYNSPDPLVRAQGDLALAQGIADIPDSPVVAEASLYGGFAILFALQQLTVVNDHPELLSEQDAFQLTRDAIHDVERGLATAESQDVAGIEAWLGQAAAVAAGDNQTNILDQAVAILSSVELLGLQARFGDVHLAGPELVDTLASHIHRDRAAGRSERPGGNLGQRHVRLLAHGRGCGRGGAGSAGYGNGRRA